MKKNDIKKIFLIAITNYFLVFAASIILPGFFSITWIIMIIISIYLLVYHWYFTIRPNNPLKEGFIAGVLLALITFIIELSLWFSTFGLFYFWNITVILQYVLIIILPILAAFLKKDEKILIEKKESSWKDRL